LQHAAQAHTRRAVGDLGLQPSQTNRGAQPKTQKKIWKSILFALWLPVSVTATVTITLFASAARKPALKIRNPARKSIALSAIEYLPNSA